MRCWLSVLTLFVPAACAERAVEFNRDVRPILSDKCWTCHGPDAAAKKIPLRLDSEAAARRVLGRDGALVARITADKARRMPPVYSGLALTPAEIETLRQWVGQGSPWQRHWSLVPPQRPALPPVRDEKWARNEIDRFVLARLEREGLAPSPEASRETLLRRVSLDLTGVPPSLAEIDAFLADRSPAAYQKAVDRLLGSPRYGERMAARWLDAARYADTNGYQFDGPRDMWRWRDWVIDSFNRNQPFDRFTLEQLAGDLLPGATRAQIIATGFNRNHRANTEDGIIPEEYAVEYVVDRVETASTVFLGLTLGCARCHNHKYDPFTQKEFYQLTAYFNNVPESGRAMKYGNSPPLVAAPTAPQEAALHALEGRIAGVRSRLAARAAATRAAEEEWRRTLSHSAPFEWAPAGAETPLPKPATLDGVAAIDVAGAGAFDIEDRFTLSAWIKPSTLDAPLLTRMTDSPHGRGYGLALRGGRLHFHLTSNYADDAIRVDSETTLAAGVWRHVLVTYTGSRMAEGIRLYIDGKPAAVKVELDSLYRPFRNAGKKFREPLRIGGGWGKDKRYRGEMRDVRVWGRVLTDAEAAALALGRPLRDLAQSTEAAARFALHSYYMENAAPGDVRQDFRELQTLLEEKEKLERSFPTVMVMAERPQRRDTFLLIRGQYNQPGEKVLPGIPAALPQPDGGAPDRLAFARWVVGPRNPLLARVAVNRFWQMYFGVGLVKTAEDFGAQGEWPSHPELLDWLATEFVRSGWDVKALQKLIVTSAAYRQSSKATPELLQRDPENRLLARASRFRLPAETIRDQALAASGLLVERVGGPSVKPYQPEGLWKDLIMQDMDYVQDHGDALHRRSLYTFWKRTVAPPMLATFDSANREACVVRESRTNTPLQALDLMNDVTFLEAARFLGQRMLKEGGADAASRLRLGFRLVTGRAPSAAETQVLRDSLLYHLDYFADEARARAYLKPGETRPDPALGARELAAYAVVGSLILNLDEAVTRQ
jgi:hypothetical protein